MVRRKRTQEEQRLLDNCPIASEITRRLWQEQSFRLLRQRFGRNSGAISLLPDLFNQGLPIMLCIGLELPCDEVMARRVVKGLGRVLLDITPAKVTVPEQVQLEAGCRR